MYHSVIVSLYHGRTQIKVRISFFLSLLLSARRVNKLFFNFIFNGQYFYAYSIFYFLAVDCVNYSYGELGGCLWRRVCLGNPIKEEKKREEKRIMSNMCAPKLKCTHVTIVHEQKAHCWTAIRAAIKRKVYFSPSLSHWLFSLSLILMRNK